VGRTNRENEGRSTLNRSTLVQNRLDEIRNFEHITKCMAKGEAQLLAVSVTGVQCENLVVQYQSRLKICN